MKRIPAIAVWDVGKTNKKVLLFNEEYEIVHEETIELPESKDEDGFPCEDVAAVAAWITDTFSRLVGIDRFEIVAVNFSGYGASFVYLDDDGNVCAPLYNYLKPYNGELQTLFYTNYGGEKMFSKLTASPVLGNLNSGMQLFRLKYEKPEVYKRIRWALHLPQYLSYVLTQKRATDITSLGCHTNLWNFTRNEYHAWVAREGVQDILAPILPCDSTASFEYKGRKIEAGFGLHDSSAALVPYLASFTEPFILVSTGTWCISLSPFNDSPLSEDELRNDCLCYLSYRGRPVKASRIFAGREHEIQAKRLAVHFKKSADYYTVVGFDPAMTEALKLKYNESCPFANRDITAFASFEEAYHQLISDIMEQQVLSIERVRGQSNAKKIFVDGGFARNEVFMCLLASSFREMQVHAATVSQASAIGAALVIHDCWNKKPVPGTLIDLKIFAAGSFAT